MKNPNAKKSSTTWPNTSSTPAAAIRNGSATSSAAGGPTTDKTQPTTCGGGVGRSGDDDMLNPEVIREAAERDRAMFRRHGSRVDGSMWVATIAALLMVFAAGVFAGWLL